MLVAVVAGAVMTLFGQPAMATGSHSASHGTGGRGPSPNSPAGGNTSPPRGDCCNRSVSDWQVVWRDDFNGASGSGVDRQSWIYDQGHCYPGCPAANWGTGEVTDYTDSPRNVALDGDGHLVITPLRDPADPGHWTSGRLETTRSDFAAPQGGALRVEGRLALPPVTGAAAQGNWSAFWMLGASFRTDGYRDSTGAGDIDIMEHINDRPEIVGAAHCGPFGTVDPCNEIPGNVGLAGTTECPRAGCLNGFHTFAVELHRECAPERIDWLVDGRVYHSARSDQPNMDAASWKLLVDRSFFIILNQSIGGTWPGAPTSTTMSGAPLVVDGVVVSVRTPRSRGGHDSGSHNRGGHEGGHDSGGDHRGDRAVRR
jgi:beta-glucanase (GH16 family)